MMNDDGVEGGINDRDFKWEAMSNYRGQRELFILGLSQSVPKDTEQTFEVFMVVI
jgi:hypothetical protein